MTLFFNPYTGLHFFEFSLTFFKRLLTFAFLHDHLFVDEVQVIVLSLVAASCALIGTFLVLRRMTMLANALSHTILLGIVIAYLVGTFFTTKAVLGEQMSFMWCFFAALIAGVVTTFATEFLHKVTQLQKDASIGLVFSTLFALGIVLVTLFSPNAHIGTELIMGNADALVGSDCTLALFTFLFNFTILAFFYKGLKITTFDPIFGRLIGFSPFAFHCLLMFSTSLSAISAFRAVGVLLVLAFIVFPPLIARLLFYELKKVLIGSVCVGVGSSFFGVALSRHLLTYYGVGLSTTGIVVCLLFALFLIIAICKVFRPFSKLSFRLFSLRGRP